VNLTTTLVILVTIAVILGTALERTPDGPQFSATRANRVIRQIRDQIKNVYSESLARGHRERVAQWAAVGVVGDHAVDMSVQTWGEAPRGPRELSYWCSALDCDFNEATGWRSLSPNLQRWKEWRAAGADVEDARKWFHLDDSIPAERASAWDVAGFEPVVAITWLRNNYSVEDALKLSHDGLLTFEDAAELSMVGRLAVLNVEKLPIREWIMNGFRGRIREIVEWEALGFTALEARTWRTAVGTAAASAVWRNLGFEPDTAKAWVQQGCSASQARKFHAVGIIGEPSLSQDQGKTVSISDLQKWKFHHEEEPYWSDEQVERVCVWLGAGFTVAAEVAAWIDLGVTPSTATAWKTVAGLSRETARAWIVEELSPQTAGAWKHTTLLPTEAREWISLGFSVQDFEAWAEGFGPINPADAKAWRDADFTILSAREWATSGYSPTLAASLRHIGLAPTEAGNWRTWQSDISRIQHWRKFGFISSGAAETWFKNGFTPEVARAWSAVAGIVPESAANWRNCGFDPRTAEAWIANSFVPARARAWQECGVTDPETVRSANLLLPVGPMSEDIAATIKEITTWIATGTSPDTIHERILKRFPPIGGEIGVWSKGS
jgi:hypothetical protein